MIASHAAATPDAFDAALRALVSAVLNFDGDETTARRAAVRALYDAAGTRGAQQERARIRARIEALPIYVWADDTRAGKDLARADVLAILADEAGGR